ncbi:hypothetical protein PDJ85_27240 [Bacillus cereus group sp. TH260-2LC]|nr:MULTISPECIES: hypothetical protein [Bacillus cereus group]MDA1532033.1 hypothetical protein [Bacillus cereus group sp. TH260-2LC]
MDSNANGIWVMCCSESCDGNVDAAGVSPAVSTFTLQRRIKEEVDL